RTPLAKRSRGAIAGALLVGCMFLADRFGLVTLIASGYRALSWVFLGVYVVPLLTVGMLRLIRGFRNADDVPVRVIEGDVS
ncbi:MAG TPA: hypothetical protein VN047_06710, partial [Sphingopyxis sp.]|nr:hypothetical protein [Sphingopyxis sp.]